MARITEEQWKLIRADFEVKGTPNRELERLYGVSEAAIRKRADKEEWIRSSSSHLIGANLQVIKDISEISAQSAHLSSQHLTAISDEVKFRLDNDRDLQAIQNVINTMAMTIDNPAHALALMSATVKHREARLGKSPDVAIQINNSSAQSVSIPDDPIAASSAYRKMIGNV